jgi:hypothetical protein
MGLILRATSVANSGNSILVQGSVLSHAQGDGNFMYLLTNMSGSTINITGSTVGIQGEYLYLTSSQNNAITAQSSTGEAQVRVYGPTVGCYLYANPAGQYGLYDRSGTAPRLVYETANHSWSIYTSQSLELYVSKSLVQVNNLTTITNATVGNNLTVSTGKTFIGTTFSTYNPK